MHLLPVHPLVHASVVLPYQHRFEILAQQYSISNARIPMEQSVKYP
nr:MAG TPA: hypothetical protein [Caudoviricetes sp.]